MQGIWLLSWRHVTHHKTQSIILIVCVALSLFLPVAAQVLMAEYHGDLTARGRATPLLAGARGNRFDLTLSALYFRPSTLEPIPFGQVQVLGAGSRCLAVPLHARATARGRPIVATSPEYFERRQLTATRGTLPLQLGEATLGAAVARVLGIGTGDAIFSDPVELYDLSRPPALKMRVVGVLAATGTADDEAVFTDIKTAWILEGKAHGHEDARSVPDHQVLGRGEGMAALAPTVSEYQEVTDQNADAFHHHGDESAFPLTAVLLFPEDVKAGTLLKARVNAAGEWQVVVPRSVVGDLLEVVARVKRLIDGIAAVLAATTGLMLVLQLLLSQRLRAGEMATLHRIGCGPWAVAGLYAVELVFLFTTAGVLAGLAVWGAVAWIPNPLVWAAG